MFARIAGRWDTEQVSSKEMGFLNPNYPLLGESGGAVLAGT